MRKLNNKLKTSLIVKSALIGAFYAVLTLSGAQLSFGSLGVQFRFAEALCVLPALDPTAIPGLFIGCLISNWVGASLGVNLAGAWDILIGSSATLIAAILTYYLRNFKIKKIPIWSLLPPIIINALFVGVELAIVLPDVYSYIWGILSVGIGQSVVIFTLGIPLYKSLSKSNILRKM